MKKLTPLVVAVTMMVAPAFTGCNNAAPTEETKEEPKVEVAPAPAPSPVTKDSLPPVDSSASTRPEPRKN